MVCAIRIEDKKYLGKKYRVISIDSTQILFYRKECECNSGYITEILFIKIPYINQYLKQLSKNYQRVSRNKLLYFAIWLYETKEIISLLDAEYDDIEQFFEEKINNRDIKLDTKEKWRIPINSYYTFISKIYKRKKGKQFFNPVPDNDLYVFSSKRKTAADLVLKKELLDYEIAKQILDHCYKRDFQMFIIISLLLYSGARISEIMSLHNDDLKVNYRFLFNEIKGAAKKTKFGVYFFPGFFVKYLKVYLIEKEMLYPKDSFVFPSRIYKGKFMRPGTVREHIHIICENLKITVPYTPHKFRHLLNRERRKKGAGKLDRILLLNQTPRETESKYYNEDLEAILELREIYDKSFPFPRYIKP